MPNFPASIPNSDYSIVSRRDARAGLPTRPPPRRSLIAPPAWSSTPVCSTTSANRLEAGADAGRHAPPPVLRGHGRNRRQDLKFLISTISVSFREKNADTYLTGRRELAGDLSGVGRARLGRAGGEQERGRELSELAVSPWTSWLRRPHLDDGYRVEDIV
jgi:hypothetical protein